MDSKNSLNSTLSEDLINNVTFTLKHLDVRCYESMDRVVGLVNLFENIMAQARQIAAKQAAEIQHSEKSGEEAEPKSE